jgi:hypothetical protein
MAGSTPFVLPQYQGSMYDLQRQQALANALMQGAMTQPQAPQAGASGQYQVAARTSPIAPISNIAQGLLANKIGSQASQGLNQLGQNQWQSLIGALGGGAAAQSPQLSPDSADGGVGVAGNAVANPFNGTDGGNGAAAASAAGPVNGVSAGPQLANNVGGNAPLNPLGMNPQLAAMMLMQSPDKYFESQAAAYKQADIVPQLRAAGIDPNSEQGHALAKALIEKNNYIAPVTGTGTFRDPRTMQPVAFNPDIPAGATPLFDATGNVAAVRPIQGAQAAMQGNAAATARGNAQSSPVKVFNNATGQEEYASAADVTNPTAPLGIRNNNPGNLRPGGNFAQYPDMQTGLTALDNNLQSYGKQGVNTISGVISKWAPPNENDTNGYIKEVSQRLGVGPNQKIDLTNPLVRQSISTAIALRENGPSGVFGSGGQQQPARFAAGAPMGAQAGAESGARNIQDELSTKYKALSGSNSEAQNTISYLQSIKDLSTKAATGQQSDRINYVNGLLSLAGSEKATDAVTANDLLKKYSNQIVARLSSNGMGTDAARSILESAYPNAKMTPQAINEAADNLIGAQQMTQAKSRLLTPLANSRDAVGYNNAEQKFDQNADPRIFQYANIQDPAQRQAFAQKLIKQDPKIVQKIKNLEQMGAF